MLKARLFNDSFPGGHSEVAPPDPIPNSEVKRFCADGSVGLPHARVGHRQVLFQKPSLISEGFFLFEFQLAVSPVNI